MNKKVMLVLLFAVILSLSIAVAYDIHMVEDLQAQVDGIQNHLIDSGALRTRLLVVDASSFEDFLLRNGR